MARISKTLNRNGTLRMKIIFRLKGDERDKVLSLGSEYSLKQAETIKTYLEDMIRAIDTGGRLKKSTEGFLSDVSSDLKERLTRAGLIEEEEQITNAELIDKFVSNSDGRKISTLSNYLVSSKRFLKFFGKDGNPEDITPERALEWKKELQKVYNPATVSASISHISMFFGWGTKKGYFSNNPFKTLKRPPGLNRERMFYVPMECYRRLLDACPDQNWRTLLAFCRIGGLRHISETSLLTWQDVNWSENCILIHSPKTEHHAGQEARVIPMFPELKEELEKQFEQAEEGGTPYILTFRRILGKNGTYLIEPLCNKFRKIIFQAGYTPWERLFHNLRESRANEIWTNFPPHIASEWLGHSQAIAMKHYLKCSVEQRNIGARWTLETNQTAADSESQNAGTQTGTLAR